MSLEPVLLVLSISHLSLVFIYVLAHYRQLYLGQLIALYIFCLIAYLLGSVSGQYLDQSITQLILRRFGSACAIIVWLISHELFIDKKKIHYAIWILAATSILLRTIWSYLTIYTESDWRILLPTAGFSQLIAIGFLFHSMYIAISDYEADLVASRRKDRIIFVLATAVQLLIIYTNTSYSLVNFMISSYTNTLNSGLLIPTYIYSAYTYMYAIFFLFWRLRILDFYESDSSSLFVIRPISVSSEASNYKENDPLIVAIIESMEVDRLYLKGKLSVNDLANHVSSQEYLVRRAINYHLGYRNFSEFINHYRVSEAAHRLKNTNEPVSNVGLNVGYTSLSAFHKAFKETYFVTPKEYRIKEKFT